MKNRKKIFLIMLTFLVLFSSLLTGCSSIESEESKLMVPRVKQDCYVYDQGNFINDDIEKEINNLLVDLEEKTTIEFVVITIPTLNDLTIEDYAVKLGNKLGIGKKDEDNGILLLISREDTKVRLEIGPGLQGTITDSKSGRILDKFFVPYREDDNYDDASLNTAKAVISCLAESEEYNFSIEGINTKQVYEEVGEDTPLYVYVIIILLVILGLIALEWITGTLFGDGFGDGIVFLILDAASDSSESSSGGSSFGGGGFNGGGASR